MSAERPNPPNNSAGRESRPRRGGGHGGPFGGHHRAMPGDKPKDFRGTLIRLLEYLRPYRGQLVIVFITAILSTVFAIVSPKILGQAITELFRGLMAQLQGTPGAGPDFGLISRVLLLLGTLYLLSALFQYIQQYIMAQVGQKTVYDMRRDVDRKLAHLPLKYFDTHAHGDILSRVINDIDNVASTLQQSVTQLMTSVITLIGVLVMMLSISPVMTLAVMATLPLYAFVTRPIILRSQKYFAGQQRELGELNGHVEELYTAHLVVKTFGREDTAIAEFDELNERLYGVGWRAQFLSGMIGPLMGLINNLGYVFVSVVGAVFVTRQAITIGDVQAFIQYARQFTQPISQTANIANIIQSTVASAERVFEILDEPQEVAEPAEPVVLENPRGEVCFDDVSFGYTEGVTVIEDLSLHVVPGQTVAIVGPTGAGKTTLVNLLMRFYDVDSGAITIDGVDIRRMHREDLRKILGMVLQDTWLFSGTIRENIAYGRQDATEEELVAASRAAQADHFIRTLPDGYDTVLNEEASNISQGQTQLLTIARALLADAPILILDEATSSVDTRTELQIQQAMERLMEGRTNFVIAHRLSTIVGADVILVVNEGQIVEEGTHDELLAKQGFYADLYNSQFAAEAV